MRFEITVEKSGDEPYPWTATAVRVDDDGVSGDVFSAAGGRSPLGAVINLSELGDYDGWNPSLGEEEA